MRTDGARKRAREIAERIDELGQVTVRGFFGGMALVRDGLQFGFVMGNSLYLRVDDKSRPDYQSLGGTPFISARQTELVTVESYYEVPGVILQDTEALSRYAVEAQQVARVARHRRRSRHFSTWKASHEREIPE